MKKRSYSFLMLGIVTLSFILFSTCTVGLGVEVDISAPKISIEYPTQNVVMRGDFLISGTASDDTSMAKVTVELLNGNEAISKEATLDLKTGKWFVKFENSPKDGKYPIADGEYIIRATAEDENGRTTPLEKSYYIDNTMPFVLLDRPATKGSDTIPDPYGNDLTFTGTMYDANVCSKIVIDFFKKVDDSLVPIEDAQVITENVGQSWTIAISGEESDNLNYSQFKALQNAMENQLEATEFFYTLTAYDTAYKYLGAEEGQTIKEGNATTHYYLYDDVVLLLNTGARLPTREELSQFDSGFLASSSFASVGITMEKMDVIRLYSIKDQLEPRTTGNFSINPLNKNPTVEISGLNFYAPNKHANGFIVNQLAGNSPVVVTIKPGPDKTPIDPEKVYIYMIKQTDLPLATPFEPFDITDPVEKEKYKIPASQVFKSGDNRMINYTLPVNRNPEDGDDDIGWYIIVDAEDQQGFTTTRRDAGSVKTKAGGFGIFPVSLNGNAPMFTADEVSPATGKVRPNASNETVITITAQDMDSKKITLYWKVKTDPEFSEANKIEKNGSVASFSDPYKFEFVFALPVSAENNGVVAYDFKISDGRFFSKVVSREYTTDILPPSIKTLEEPSEMKDAPQTPIEVLRQSTTLTIKGTVDSDSTKGRFTFVKKGSVAPTLTNPNVTWHEARILGDETKDKEFTVYLTLVDGITKFYGENDVYYTFCDDTNVYSDVKKLCTAVVDLVEPEFEAIGLYVDDEEQGFNSKNTFNLARKFTFKGSVIDDGCGLASFTITEGGLPVYTLNIPADKAKVVNEFTWTKEVDANTSGQFNYVISATDKAGNRKDFVKSVYIDSNRPRVYSMNFSEKASYRSDNSAMEDGVDVINSTVSLTASISKQNVKKVAYVIIPAGIVGEEDEDTRKLAATKTYLHGTEDEDAAGNLPSTTLDPISLNTTTLVDNTKYVIYFYVKGEAEEVFEDNKYFIVDQNSDKPLITVLDKNNSIQYSDTSLTDKTLMKRDQNYFEFQITDDDGILENSMKVYLDGTQEVSVEHNACAAGDTTTVRVIVMLPSNLDLEKAHYITVSLKEKNNVTTTLFNNAETKIYFWMDENAPEIEFTKLNDQDYDNTQVFTQDPSIKFGGKITECNALDYVKYYLYPEDLNPEGATESNIENWRTVTDIGARDANFQRIWSATYTATQSVHIKGIKFALKDNFGNMTVSSKFGVNIKYDSSAPTIAFDEATNNMSTFHNSEKTLKISGVAVDDNLESIAFKVVKGTEPPVSVGTVNEDGTIDGWQTANGTTVWTTNIDMNGKDEGSWTVAFVAVDKSKQTSSIISKTFTIDSTDPVISVTPLVAYNKTGTVTITGTASDTNIDKVTYSQNGGAETDVVLAGNAFNITISGLAEGQQEWQMFAYDKAGRKANSEKVKTIVDKTAPVIDASSIKTEGTLAGGVTWYGSLTVEIEATVTDSNSVASVEYGVSQVSGVQPTKWNSMGLSGNSATSPAVQIVNGTNYIWMRASDVAGNECAAVHKLTANCDNTAPTSAVTKIEIDEVDTGKTSGTFTVNGNNQISITFNPLDTGGSGVNSVKVKAGDDNFTTGAIPAVNNVATIDVSSLTNPEAIQPVYVQVIDNVGNSVVRNVLTLNVDKTNPEINIVSPANGTRLTGRGNVINGTASDAGTSIKSVSWMIPTKEAAPHVTASSVGWTSCGALTWCIEFTEADTLYAYANETYGTEVSVTGYIHSNIWLVPVYFRVEDNAGNVYLKRDFSIEIDPDGDKPIVDIAYPDNGKTYGGTVRVNGTAVDNGSIKAVYIQIDSNADGSFADDETLFSTGKYSSFYTFEAKAETTNEDAWWGLKANNTANWYLKINENKHFMNGGNKATIKLRARAIDNDDKVGPWTETMTLKFDSGAPTLEDLELVQWSNNVSGTGSIVARKTYEADMWIRGKWWLYGNALDNGTVEDINLEAAVTDVPSVEGSLKANPSWFTWVSKEGKTGYTINIPIDTTAGIFVGKNMMQTYITITDSGESPIDNTEIISIKYDNTAPTFISLKSGDANVGLGEGEKRIVQSDGSFTMKAVFEENESELDKAFVWIMRQDSAGNNKRVYNPAVNVTNRRTNLTDADMSDDEYGIPRLTKTVTRSSTKTLSYAGLGSNENIKVSTYVSIGGIDRKITAIDGDVATIDTDVPVTETTAAFAYAMAIDHGTTEMYPAAYPSDDGDGISEEFVRSSGNTYNCSVWIDSLTIPDGKVTVYYAAFDKAGNVTTGSRVTQVENNGPKITKVFLGTDLNGDGSVANVLSGEDIIVEEVIEYTVTGSSNVTLNVDGSVPANGTFTVKDKSTIAFEVLNGNGSLYYDLNIAGVDKVTCKGKTGSELTSLFIRDNSVAEVMVPVIIQAADFGAENESTSSTDGKNIKVTIWDSTEEGAIGETTLNAILNTKLIIDVIDDVAPTASISSLFWNDEDDNSLFENDRTNGHIDLPGSWNNNGNSAVSGKIVLRGQASDNKRLSSLHMYIDDYAMGQTNAGTITVTPNTTVQEVATYENGAWTSKISGFTITSSTADQSGHFVNWEYVWDSSLIASVAKKNINVYVTSKDTTPNVTVATNLQVDVVPYITDIVRQNDLLTIRSRYGKTPVIQGETVTLKGFNFKTGMTSAVNSATATTNFTDSKTATMIVPAKSGYLVVTSGGVTSNNNTNDDTAKYNREEDPSNISWTFSDGRYVSVWNVNHKVPGSNANSLMPTFDFDNAGQINTSWAFTGSASIELVRGLDETGSHSIFTCYDQPTHYSAIGVDKTTGDMGVLFFPDHVGVGGVFSHFALGSANVVGGAGYIIIDKNSSVTMDARTAIITTGGNNINPCMPMDGKMNTPYYPLQSHEMTRNPGSFSAPQSIRSGNFGHTLFYDRTNGSLKYSCVQKRVSPNNNEYWAGTMNDWSVIDGTATGKDRLHTTQEGTVANKQAFRVLQNAHPNLGGNAGSYLYDIPNLTPSAKSTTSVTVPLSRNAWQEIFNDNGVTICFMNDSQNFNDTYNRFKPFTYRDATNITWAGSSVTLTFDEIESNEYSQVTLYAGAKTEVITAGVESVASAGEYSTIDVTSHGYPVIMYKAGNKVRLAYTNSTNPAYNNWVRQETGLTGGLYVSMKIDTDDNNKLHAVYKDGSKLMYVSATRNANGSYNFAPPEEIDRTGSLTMSTLSLFGTTPVVSYLNSESSEDGIKYAKRISLDGQYVWDYQVVPGVFVGNTEYFVSSENYRVYVGSNPGTWNTTQDGIAMADCESFIGFKSTGRVDVVFLKEEN